ncbi:Biopolymer transport protein ExbD/TolR [Denitrovibrio acetiphilus DSM 12809]|uniref:Biopolymer transport protein ExbD/TolR n=1 Tax=Denitrovibrio acetiphilus (strain DSM 12809 / NBRC 114555 / N2460) TaxID=522772 RepID=D4H648_DENA2|nr:biopolymer transporter ExbD [Denitrovibrio acetiphilus]ADD67694.1 Biopolymer transport protein ExbD/TolR [Denitrovibrio acetiphilus DSM 12809]
MREKPFDSINVVPFIDIMLVLLTIVLATATFMTTGMIKVDLPKVSSAAAHTEPVLITLTDSGKYYIKDKPVTLEDLSDLLVTLDKNTLVSVAADKNATIQPFASLMSLLNKNNFQRVSLSTEIHE